MYIDSATIKRGNKTYHRRLLRTSFRENGKVRHKTLLNLSNCTNEEVAALEIALKHKGKLESLTSLNDFESKQGKRIGAAWTLNTIAKRIGITKALGSNRQAKLALLQVIARIIYQGSRLSAVRLAMSHALCETIGIDTLNEDDLYENLAWLAEHQESIEKKLFKNRFPDKAPTLFLYDVTSSYLEGTKNEMAAFGYNRDRKKGKKQIVVGLLTGPDGLPVAVRVFKGNTNDTNTVSEQIRILAKNFGVKEITLVGDRGMLKGPQIDALPDDFRYITAITKPQILNLLSEGIVQMELFSEQVCEVESQGIRYVLRRNPLRAKQMAESRCLKMAAISTFVNKRNAYLAEHPKASAKKSLEKVIAKIQRLKANSWLKAIEESRKITLIQDEQALSQASLLDGCYIIKSDVSKDCAYTQTLHDRYCDLEKVERAFRTMKTVHLELRPVFVKKEVSTKGHVFAVMLALLLQRELEQCWRELDITVEEGIDELGTICANEFRVGKVTINDIPKPRKRVAELLKNASVVLPSKLPAHTPIVHTKKKLASKRIS
jgi:transposase